MTPLNFPWIMFLQDRNWTEYWRLLFSKVTIDDIKTFEKTYKGSDEEIETLRSAYVDYEGDMDKILEGVCHVQRDLATAV